MKKSFLKLGIAVITLSALMAACYPGGPTYIEDYDVVYTININDTLTADLSKTKFHLADTVIDLSDPQSSPDPIGNGSQILSLVRSNMLDYNYTEVPDTANIKSEADFLVLVSVVRSNNYVQTWWPGWGGWWGGWGWGGCCYYPPVTTVTNFRTGSLIVEIVDVKSLDPDEEIIPIIWRGSLEGLFEGSSSNITNRSKRGVDQMFNQSDYLKR